MAQNLRKRKLKLIEKHGCKCQKCPKSWTIDELTVHHVIPRSMTSGHRGLPDNGMLLCRDCHDHVHEIIRPGTPTWQYLEHRFYEITEQWHNTDTLNSFCNSVFQATITL